MRPIFSRIVPGAVDVGLVVKALMSRAARMVSLTLRGWVGGRRWFWFFGGGDGNRDAAHRTVQVRLFFRSLKSLNPFSFPLLRSPLAFKHRDLFYFLL